MKITHLSPLQPSVFDSSVDSGLYQRKGVFVFIRQESTGPKLSNKKKLSSGCLFTWPSLVQCNYCICLKMVNM